MNVDAAGNDLPGIDRLRVEDLVYKELADAVWLAAATQRCEPEAEPETTPAAKPFAGPPPADSGPAAEPPARDWLDGHVTTAAPAPRREEDVVRLLPAIGDGAPAATELLRRSAEIVRALRPLRRKVPSADQDEVILDEVATAERAAQDGLWLPVTKPDTTRWLDLTVVVDTGPSMAIWRSTVTAFLSLVQQLGAFRTIQLRLLDTHRSAGGSPTIPALRGGTPGTPVRGPAELLDPSGRRIVLVVSDCVSECWRTEQVSPMLCRWGTTMPVAVLNPLPQWQWGRRGLALHRARLTVPGSLRPNGRWGLELPDAWSLADPGSLIPAGTVPVPILELEPRWLGWWARLVAGQHSSSANAMVLLANPAGWPPRPETPAGTAPAGDRDAQAEVLRFLSVASPPAYRLATLLAAVPVSMPIARFVQAELIPDSGPAHLAEVFNSGLLHPPDPGTDERSWEAVTFDINDSVRQVLLSGARRSETAKVIRLVAERFGVLGRVRAALDKPDATPDPDLTADNAYLVAIERTVMRALSGPYLSRADRLSQSTSSHQPAPVTLSSETATRASKNTVSENMPDVAEHAELPSQRSATSIADPETPVVDRTGPTDPTPVVPYDPAPAVGLPPKERRTDGNPPVWGNVPPRNPNFTGRTELLEELDRRLETGTTAILPAALHGMGGIGKTHMAVEYIYRHLAKYDVVWWIQAAQVGQVRAGLTELARRLRLPGASEANAAVPEVLEALRLGDPYDRWLLVFDAAESPETIRHYFPSNGPGDILITSRNPDWASIARPLEITVFNRAESIELLKRRGPEIDEGEADQLAEALGDLPLAIEQAAAWRAETGMPVREYLRLFDEKVAEILDTSAPSGYEVSVAAAWNVSFDALKHRSPAAHQLLQVCAFFAPEPISRALFAGARGVSISPELDVALRDPMQLGRAIRDINRYGLAKIDHRNNTLQLHRLVQLVLRNRMSPQQREVMQHGAHVLLASYDPNDPLSPDQWPRYQTVLPHVFSSELTDCDDPWVRQLVINLMKYLYFWGDHEEAAAVATAARDRWTQRLGEADSQVLEAASQLGMFLWALGRYPEAARVNQRTLELCRARSGDNSEDTIIAELRVAVDMKARGDFAAARTLNEEIHTRVRAQFGDDDPVTLQTAHDLGVSLRLCGEYQRALELDEYTYQRRAEVFGQDHLDTLNTRSGLAMDRRELGDYQLARDEHEWLATRVRDLLGEDKADTLRRYGYLAVARRKVGDHEGALGLSRKALETYRRRYGRQHPVAMACAIDHANDLRHADDLEGAWQLGQETFELYRAMLGETHPYTLSAAVNLAVTLRLRGDVEAARQLNERSLDRLRAALGPDHPHALVCAIDLASDAATLGETDTALTLGQDATERADRVLGAEHPITLAGRLNVAMDLRMLGRTQEADARHADVVGGFRRVLGERHPATQDAVRGLRANCDIDPLPL
ncbi:MAG TPA: FxSxx-COOH system tetratricopeptide repeat protein [Actinophytocola sp.]|uniref:FxSxx-COOH system tetratricopeptide repeat protein n=1 Tax=Actinophytocola sp. TaxID=1872138 RepID=UPI002DBFD86C|nr:FxSxx-COOH system tetratricopeptide repeat protein [Actinophytocola sp.]HEU5470527.1 FxSxx-COOH system tetratricopeptide repeat protein [Actinophytocola sp.]